MGKKNSNNIEELVDLAYETEDRLETQKITKKILALDPNNKDALILLADTVDDLDELLTLLTRAYELCKKDFEEMSLEEDEEALETDEGMLYIGVMQRLVIPLADSGKTGEALEIASKLMELDPENIVDSHTLYYFALLKDGKYSRVLEETLEGEVRSPAWAWALFVSVFALSREVAEKKFWEAVKFAPDAPFYMCGRYEEPVSDSERDEDDFSFSLLFSDVVMPDEYLSKWVIGRTVLFGLLSKRITTDEDEDEYSAAIEILKNEGLFELYNDLKKECKKLDLIEDDEEFDMAIIDQILKTVDDN